MEVEDRLASAFAARLKSPGRDFMRPRLLAGVCLLIQNTATASWFLGEHKDLPTAAKHAFLSLARVVGEESANSPGAEVVAPNKATALKRQQTSRNKKK